LCCLSFFFWPLCCLSFFCWPLCCLSFFFWLLCCLSLSDLRILNNPFCIFKLFLSQWPTTIKMQTKSVDLADFIIISSKSNTSSCFHLRYLCLSVYSGVQHILCSVIVLFVLVLCALCCRFLWIAHFWWPLRYSLTFKGLYLNYDKKNQEI
jgi:hypothetical protein